MCRERNAAYNILSSPRSSDQSRSGSRIILERGRNLLLSLVIPGKPMNPRLDQDKTELGILVFAVDLQMLADGDRLFDEVPKVLRDGWAKSYPQTKGILLKRKEERVYE